jgi:hypothetical protein
VVGAGGWGVEGFVVGVVVVGGKGEQWCEVGGQVMWLWLRAGVMCQI